MSILTTVLRDRFEDAKTAINSRYQIGSFLDARGIHVESNKQVCCPFHDDSTPSFSVNFETNEWKCFGCGEGGRFVDLWRTYQNKYEHKVYSVYTAIETILAEDAALRQELGFNSIFKTAEDEFDLFKLDDNGYHIDELLRDTPKISIINTDSMQQVLSMLKRQSPEVLVRFILDCENGLSESQLISKYYKNQHDIETYISSAIGQNQEDVAELTSAFLEAIE